MTVVFDIDGVLAQNHERVDLIDCENPDWDTFFLRCAEDTKLPLTKLVDNLHGDLAFNIVLLSTRPERTRDITELWLEGHHIFYSDLLMTPDDWYKKGVTAGKWKIEKLYEIEDLYGSVYLIFEDDPNTIWAMREEGWPVVPIYSGYYDCPKRRVPRTW